LKKAKRPGSQPAPGAAQAARVLQALRDFVSDSDRKLSEIERRAGYGPGYLQQVLAGAVELKVAHLEEILAALEVPPSRFWPRLLPWTSPGRPLSAALAQGLRVNADVVVVYAGGIAEVLELRRRLGVCERRLGALCASQGSVAAQPAVLVARR
jgi:transcriptional regulator with XRE-family HTH domain